jgi:hypothetical protein
VLFVPEYGVYVPEVSATGKRRKVMDNRDPLALASRITNGHALAALRAPIGSARST